MTSSDDGVSLSCQQAATSSRFLVLDGSSHGPVRDSTGGPTRPSNLIAPRAATQPPQGRRFSTASERPTWAWTGRLSLGKASAACPSPVAVCGRLGPGGARPSDRARQPLPRHGHVLPVRPFVAAGRGCMLWTAGLTTAAAAVKRRPAKEAVLAQHAARSVRVADDVLVVGRRNRRRRMALVCRKTLRRRAWGWGRPWPSYSSCPCSRTGRAGLARPGQALRPQGCNASDGREEMGATCSHLDTHAHGALPGWMSCWRDVGNGAVFERTCVREHE